MNNNLWDNPFTWRHPLGKLDWYFRAIKWTIQRSRRGYCDLDVWEFYDFNLNTMIGALEQLSENLNGVPNSYYNLYEEDADLAAEEWQKDLRAIVQKLKTVREKTDGVVLV